MPRDAKPNINPLMLVVAKQRVGDEDADLIALPLLLHFDAAKRGQCTAAGCNHLTTHLLIASYIAAHTKSKQFHDIITKAYSMLMKAADRPTHLLDLTTSEYQALRSAFSWYLRSLPMVQIGMLTAACQTADRMMSA